MDVNIIDWNDKNFYSLTIKIDIPMFCYSFLKEDDEGYLKLNQFTLKVDNIDTSVEEFRDSHNNIDENHILLIFVYEDFRYTSLLCRNNYIIPYEDKLINPFNYVKALSRDKKIKEINT